jgi:hypothetical protein
VAIIALKPKHDKYIYKEGKLQANFKEISVKIPNRILAKIILAICKKN